jgi:hypothetical protein
LFFIAKGTFGLAKGTCGLEIRESTLESIMESIFLNNHTLELILFGTINHKQYYQCLFFIAKGTCGLEIRESTMETGNE